MKQHTKAIAVFATVFAAAFAAVVLVAMVACFLPQSVAYAQQTNTVTLITDSGEPPFWVIEVATDGTFTIPDATPSRDGYTFKAWSDGFASYEAGKTYTVGAAQDGNLDLHAVWELVVQHNKPKPLFNSGEKIALYVSLGVLAVVFLFAYYWFGIKERSLKQLGVRIAAIFSKKNKHK